MRGPDGLQIRHLGPEDWRTWRTVRQRSLRETPGAFAASAHRWLGAWDREATWRGRLLAVHSVVASIGDDVVGTAGLDLAGNELVGMWVAPARRGLGIGHRLVEAVAAGATGPLSLRVMADNASAIGFYERCGFVLTSAPVDDEGCVSMVRPSTG